MPTSTLLLAEGIGFLASAVSLVLWWPQAARVWRHRHDGGQLGGVSLSTQVLLLVNAALWGAYAVVTGSFWVGAPGLVNAPLALLTMALLRRSRWSNGDRPVAPQPTGS
jgi:uncharacterized protein with PQ loop repeat